MEIDGDYLAGRFMFNRLLCYKALNNFIDKYIYFLKFEIFELYADSTWYLVG